MPEPYVVSVANQKGGTGKTTMTVNLAAVVVQTLSGGLNSAVPVPVGRILASLEEALSPTPDGKPRPRVLVISTDRQRSALLWALIALKQGTLTFDFIQIEDPAQLKLIPNLPYDYVFCDTPGSMDNEEMLEPTLAMTHEALVVIVPDFMCQDPTRNTVNNVLIPLGIPFHVVINNWDPQKGKTPLKDTAKFIVGQRWPMCKQVIRSYRLHADAPGKGMFVTSYPKNRTALEATKDFLLLALERGYGGQRPEPNRTGGYANHRPNADTEE